jgi:hypothetical protein
MTTRNSDQAKNGEKKRWAKPLLVDLDKGMDSVEAGTGVSTDGFASSTGTS